MFISRLSSRPQSVEFKWQCYVIENMTAKNLWRTPTNQLHSPPQSDAVGIDSGRQLIAKRPRVLGPSTTLEGTAITGTQPASFMQQLSLYDLSPPGLDMSSSTTVSGVNILDSTPANGRVRSHYIVLLKYTQIAADTAARRKPRLDCSHGEKIG